MCGCAAGAVQAAFQQLGAPPVAGFRGSPAESSGPTIGALFPNETAYTPLHSLGRISHLSALDQSFSKSGSRTPGSPEMLSWSMTMKKTIFIITQKCFSPFCTELTYKSSGLKLLQSTHASASGTELLVLIFFFAKSLQYKGKCPFHVRMSPRSSKNDYVY